MAVGASPEEAGLTSRAVRARSVPGTERAPLGLCTVYSVPLRVRLLWTLASGRSPVASVQCHERSISAKSHPVKFVCPWSDAREIAISYASSAALVPELLLWAL